MAKRRLYLLGLFKIRLANVMVLLSGYDIRQSNLAMTGLGNIPKARNRYSVIRLYDVWLSDAKLRKDKPSSIIRKDRL